MLLTPEFGSRVRVGIIITELELEPDPIIEPGTLCNRCMACVRECPGGCIPADRTIKANVKCAIGAHIASPFWIRCFSIHRNR